MVVNVNAWADGSIGWHLTEKEDTVEWTAGARHAMAHSLRKTVSYWALAHLPRLPLGMATPTQGDPPTSLET